MEGWIENAYTELPPIWLITVHLYCALTSSSRTLISDGNIYPVLVPLSVCPRDGKHAEAAESRSWHSSAASNLCQPGGRKKLLGGEEETLP